MKKIILLLILLFTFITTNAQSSNELNPNLYGYWINLDGDILHIQLNNTFIRRNSAKIISTGKLEIVDGDLRVIRTDVNDEYSLGFHIRNAVFVVTKPKRLVKPFESQAWLFTKIGN